MRERPEARHEAGDLRLVAPTVGPASRASDLGGQPFSSLTSSSPTNLPRTSHAGLPRTSHEKWPTSREKSGHVRPFPPICRGEGIDPASRREASR